MALSKLEQAADKRAQETIHPFWYSEIVLILTGDIKLSKKVSRNIVLTTRFILLLDSFYETNEPKYAKASEKTRNQLLKSLLPAQQKEFEKLYAKLSSFWKYEKSLTLKKKFSEKDRLTYLRKKSSDVFLYTLVSGFVSPFPRRIVRALHAVQQLNDIYDDCIDMQEDRETNSPNLIFLFSWKYTTPRDLKPKEREEIILNAALLLLKVTKNTNDIVFVWRAALDYYAKIVNMLLLE